MEEEQNQEKTPVSDKAIEQCIATLSNLLNDTNQLFELPEEQRVELMKVAGLLSRPTREEQDRRRKDAKKAAKRKMIERDKHARKETGIRSAREDAIFIAPKFLELPKEVEPKKLISPRNCYVCKA